MLSNSFSNARHLDNGTKFEDPEFPPDDSSFSKSEDLKKIPEDLEWKRASEIVDDPNFIVDGATRFDINQGTYVHSFLLK